ncbi:hypothetical protein SEUCBS139899_006313 [Sporothrix eucalyptigena]|uniref:Integral membrane protein, Mpv17/PMP22 family n=1 Tax=Sporothrix eucalyptigena TaxID=1812306 RepID=A0ABP0CTH1_9PEZI
MRSHMTAAVVQATTLGAASNILAQFISAYRGSSGSDGHHRSASPIAFIDMPQLLRFVIFALLTAPMNYKFQQLLEYAFPAHGNGRRMVQFRHRHRDIDLERLEKEREKNSPPRFDWKNTMAKWFLDCISLGTFINTAAFLIIMGVLKGQSVGQIGVNLRNELAPIIFAGYRVWPFASFISFTCLPLERRIAWLSLVGLLWGVYMSTVAERV